MCIRDRPEGVRAELNAHAFGLHSQGSAAFQSAAKRIHDLLFESPLPLSDRAQAERVAA